MSNGGKVCIGIDLGGTFIKLAAMDANKRVFGGISVPTPAQGSAQDVIDAMVAGARKVMADNNLDRSDVLGVGIGSPGPLSRSRGVVVASPNIPAFRDVPLRDAVSKALNLPADLENDANAAALGEYLCGAGRGVDTIVMLTLGTGVGGGIIEKGDVWHGSHDFAAEIGHMIVQPGGLPCNCGTRGCLEQYASAYFMAKRTMDAIREGRKSSLADVLARKGEIDARDINEARKAGDALAAEMWDSAIYHLALACASLERLLDTDLIVLAGGLTNAGDDLMSPLQKYYSELEWKITPQMSKIVIATLGSDAGVTGAAGVAWNAFGKA